MSLYTEQEIADLKREQARMKEQLAGVPTRVAKGGGGGGLSVSVVNTLPAIPSSGAKIVYWTSAGVGTGDDQLWIAYAGQSAWTPMQFTTTHSGAPA